MKEVEKNEIKRLSDRLDAIRHQQAGLSLVESADKYAELEKEKETLEAEIIRLREVHSQKLSKEAQKLMNLPFRRAITKKSRPTWASWRKACVAWLLSTRWRRWAGKWGSKRWQVSRRASSKPSASQALRTPVVRRMSWEHRAIFRIFHGTIYTAYIQVHF